MRAFLIFLLSAASFTLLPQTCLISNEFNTEKALVRNKVREVKVYQSRDSAKKLLYVLYPGKNGCLERLLHYDQQSNGTEPLQTSWSLFANGKRSEYSQGRLIQGKLREFEHVTEDQSGTGKKFFRKRSEYQDIVTHTLYYMDTLDGKKINMRIIRTMPGGDTISMVINTFDHVTRSYTLRNMTTKGWEESEKLITAYENGQVIQESFYRKGKLERSLTRDDLQKQNTTTLSPGNVSENPLPTPPAPKPDSSYTDDVKYVYGKQTFSKKNLKYLVVHYPALYDAKQTDHYDVIEQKSGLIQKRLYSRRDQGLYFEYNTK